MLTSHCFLRSCVFFHPLYGFAPWKKSYDKLSESESCSIVSDSLQHRQCIKKQRHYFANKGPYSQSYGFSNSHVWMWELDHKEGWVLKNWCFQTVVLEKTLENPLDYKEIKPVNPKGNRNSEISLRFIPYEFRDGFFYFCKKCHWNFSYRLL